MNVAKFVELVKHFESVEPAVLAEIQATVKQFGPVVVGLFPKFSGYETELEKALDFLSATGGKAFQYLDQVLSLLAAFEPKAA
jgi:hypothetical protein